MAINPDWTVYAPIIIVVLIAIFGYFATRRATAPDGWYQQINKPPYTPPNLVFGIVWTILYILIIIAWVRANAKTTNQATYDAINWLFTINIILNLAWSFLFFGDGNIVAGLVILILLLVTTGVLVCLLSFDPWGFSFMLLYFIWLLFVTALNFYIVRHNYIIHPISNYSSMYFL